MPYTQDTAQILKNIILKAFFCIFSFFFFSAATFAFAQENEEGASETADFIGTGGIDEVDLKEFSGISEYIQLNGVARITIDDFSVTDKESYILRLTPRKPNANGQIAGSAFLKLPVKWDKQGSPFSAFFRFRVTADNVYDGSGLVFVIHSDRRGAKALGKCKNCMGYDGDFDGFSAIKPSLGIEFDIQSSGDDLDYNMIGYNVHGDLTSVISSYAPTVMNNGIPWNVWIDYDGDLLEVRMSMENERPIEITLVDNARGGAEGLPLDLSRALIDTKQDGDERPVYIGFTADPGRYPAYHDILQFRFRPESQPYGDYNPETEENDRYVVPGAEIEENL